MSIVSPEAVGAGLDACAAASDRKYGKYQEYLAELREEGLEYLPVVWSCWGRPGSAASTTVRALACAAARRRGIPDPAVLEQHLNAIVGCFVWKRAACMALACLGRPAREDVAALLDAAVRCGGEGEGSDGEEAAGDAAASGGAAEASGE